ncbi:hypothetical protein A2686_03705 [Candidatus Woesebacteria bacterium RIFCSPHIGHO2_01_FULL_38_10]|nr:MAG: hypothetical protein A2686_03705 [Candidatus Woesebacteria bacterium RIFCSPHIGHO2_01_FULL_38_10]
MEPRLTTKKAITNFIFASDKPTKADLVIIPGSSHHQLPKKAVFLYKNGFCKKLLFTGGYSPKISKKECDFGKDIALKSGVPLKAIYFEGVSQNTKENAFESFKLTRKHKLKHKRLLLVCKPYHARRLKMTFANFFPNSQLFMIPVKDERDITKHNWWKNKDKIEKVMEEIGKISEYFLKGDLSL